MTTATVPEDGDKATLNIQPAIPFSLNEDWEPHIEDHPPGHMAERHRRAIRNSVRSRRHIAEFLSLPAKPTETGIVWGAGPVFLLPTATDELLGGGKWGAGPTAVVLKQDGPWTYGFLGNHVWSFAGQSDREDVSSTFLQPFISYTTKDAWTFSLNTESTCNWETNDWSVPINFAVAKLITID